MMEKENNLINQNQKFQGRESLEDERKRLEEETISYEDFKKISEMALKQYKKNPQNIDLSQVPQAIEGIIESFPAEETRELCRKIIFPSIDFERRISFLKDVEKENFEILKEKTDKWIKIISEEFKKKRGEDFTGMDSNLTKHLWVTPLRSLKGIIEIAEEERLK